MEATRTFLKEKSYVKYALAAVGIGALAAISKSITRKKKAAKKEKDLLELKVP